MNLNGYGNVPDNCIVIFTGSYCAACRQLENTLSHTELNIPVKYISVEKYSHAASMCGVMSLPTMLFVKNGIIKSNIVGSVTTATIQAEIK